MGQHAAADLRDVYDELTASCGKNPRLCCRNGADPLGRFPGDFVLVMMTQHQGLVRDGGE
jgi:hypothetical protein